jgi:hypothetical protein
MFGPVVSVLAGNLTRHACASFDADIRGSGGIDERRETEVKAEEWKEGKK